MTAKEFWNWFENNKEQFFFLNQIENESEKERILYELETKLEEFSNGLYFEIGGFPDEEQDLIITAGGNLNYFSKVIELTEEAPEIKNWNIIAFKPPVNENFKMRYQDIIIDTKETWFKLKTNSNSKYNIDLFFENYESNKLDSYREASQIVLETILGEKVYFKLINSIQIYGAYNLQIEDALPIEKLYENIIAYKS